MKMSIRGWLVVGTVAAVVLATMVLNGNWLQAAEKSSSKQGQLTEESLGNLLKAMGLEPEKNKKRYDFAFKAIHEKEEWHLSMSTVLSQNGKWIWVMAWLDELPRSAADVPRTALLRLLADNDHLGNGKFFAYIPSNRRFVLQRVIPNEDMTTANFQAVLQDLGISVIQTYPHWTTENWKGNKSNKNPEAGRSGDSKNQQKAGQQPAPQRRQPARTATGASKFQGKSRN